MRKGTSGTSGMVGSISSNTGVEEAKELNE